MTKVALYLKTPLFALKGEEDPIPTKAVILEGNLFDETRGGVYIETTAYYSVESKSPSLQIRKALKGGSVKLYIPSAKIDHMRLI